MNDKQALAFSLWRAKKRGEAAWLSTLRLVFDTAFILALLANAILLATSRRGTEDWLVPTWATVLATSLGVVLLVLNARSKGKSLRTDLHILSRMFTARRLQDSLDVFRKTAREAKNEAHVADGLRAFVTTAVEAIDADFFPDLKVKVKLLREIKSRLSVVGHYPGVKDFPEDWEGDASTGPGHACLAYKTLQTVYVPYVSQKWGVHADAATTPAGGISYDIEAAKAELSDAQSRSSRTVLFTPTRVVTDQPKYKGVPYGVLLIESAKRDAFKARHFYCAALAASFMGQAFEIDKEARIRLSSAQEKTQLKPVVRNTGKKKPKP